MSLDYGIDLSCVEDLDEEGSLVSDPRVVLGQALCRRWMTPRGMLLEDQDYGTDLTEWINDDIDEIALVRFRAEMRAEALKDERVIDCVVSTTWDAETKTIFATASITGNEGPLTLKIAVTAVTVELLNAE